jgi:hypothetical protein
MTPHSEDYENIRSYLLGVLSDDDRQIMDERLLSESGFLEEVLVAEEELMDDYVNDDLPADSRLRFEQHFLITPERQQKLKFAFALSRYASQASKVPASASVNNQAAVSPTDLNWYARFKSLWSGQTPAFRFAAVVAVIAIVGVTVWLLRPGRFAPKTFANVTLIISSGERSEGPTSTKVKLPSDVDALKVLLKLPESSNPAQRYRVEWMNDQGVKKPLTITNADAQSLTVVIPARELASGQNALRLYVINSDGSEQRINGDYFFTVE